MKRCLLLVLAFGAPLFAAEPELLVEARRALAESIPQVAIAKLQSLRATGELSHEEQGTTALLLAEALLRTSKFDAALEVVRPLAAAGDLAAELWEAHILASAGKWAEALPIYERLAKAPNPRPSARLGLAESLQATGRTEEAIRTLEGFVKDQPGATTARLRLAGLLAEARRADRARTVLQGTVVESPGDRLWQRYIEGRLLLLANEPAQALDVFEEVIRVPENLSENLLVAATLAITDARIVISGNEIADRVLESFIWKNPNSSFLELVFRRLDQVYAGEKEPPEGELQKWAADAEKRRAALARYYVARLQLRARKFDRATISTDVFVARYRDHPLLAQVHLMQAEIQIERGQFPRAVLALEAAERHAKTEELRAEVELRTGLVHYQQGEYLLAANKFASAARRSPKLAKIATFDAALATLNQKNYEHFFEQYRELAARHPDNELRAQLLLAEGLTEARDADPRAAETLQLFLVHFPKHPRQAEARLALAELAFQGGDDSGAARYLQTANVASRNPETEEHAEYLAIFVEESKTKRDDAKVVDLARRFLARFAVSPLLPEVRMKLGQVYFRNDDFPNAETQFATLAREAPASPYAESALFLAGQSAMRTINPDAVGRALELFDQVVKRDGALKLYARQQQAIVQTGLGKETEAIKLYDIILEAQPPPERELRLAALCAKGDNLALLGRKEPAQLEAAVAVFDQLSAAETPPRWRNQALYKRGNALVLLGRGPEALVAYYDVLGRSAAGEREYLWYYKAGFEAARICEAEQNWKAAIGIYEKIATAEGPRAREAKDRVKRLRLEHFIEE